MSGNVWEWTCSKYKESFNDTEERCGAQASLYSLLGSSWLVRPWGGRAAIRDYFYPNLGYDGLGFDFARAN